MKAPKYDWKTVYNIKSGSHKNKYPSEEVISFVLRTYGKRGNRRKIKILDVGCGWGNNLAFLVNEGFDAYGIDISETAVKNCKRFTKNVVCGNVTNLPYDSDYFDVVIDRASIQHLSYSDQLTAYKELHRVLKRGGKVFSTILAYGDNDFFTSRVSRSKLNILFKSFKHVSTDYRRYTSEGGSRKYKNWIVIGTK